MGALACLCDGCLTQIYICLPTCLWPIFLCPLQSQLTTLCTLCTVYITLWFACQKSCMQLQCTRGDRNATDLSSLSALLLWKPICVWVYRYNVYEKENWQLIRVVQCIFSKHFKSCRWVDTRPNRRLCPARRYANYTLPPITPYNDNDR